MPNPQSTVVQWWSLNRQGQLADPQLFADRPSDAPPPKNGSLYTPNFLVDDELPGTHLHYRDGHIIGIHGEADLVHLQLTLAFCLKHEAYIINALRPIEFDIPLADVLLFLSTSEPWLHPRPV